MDKSTHEIRCKQWKQIISNCLASGQTKKQWCRDNGVSEKSFYYWQRILRNESYIDLQHSAQIVPVRQAQELPTALVELKDVSKNSITTGVFRPDIIIRKGQICLEISNSASKELLSYLGGILHAE